VYGRGEKCVADKPDWMRETGRSRGKWNTDTKMGLICRSFATRVP